MEMLWRGIDYIVDQLVDSTVDQQNIKIDNNNTINTVLPAEMLQRIFRVLPPEDLKVAVTVCRLWRDIGSQGTLWTWVNLCAHRGNLGSMPGS